MSSQIQDGERLLIWRPLWWHYISEKWFDYDAIWYTESHIYDCDKTIKAATH